ncbi:hypothetical protein AVEN_73804-1, partial [Araneus ventricosus]
MARSAEDSSDTEMHKKPNNSIDSSSNEVMEINQNIEINKERNEHSGILSQQILIPGNGKSVNPTAPRPRDRSPTSVQISDEYIVENSTAIAQAIALKQSLAEWSRTMRSYPKEDPGYQRVLEETKKVNINLNTLLTTLGVPLYKLPESNSHLAQITERVKRNLESETIKISQASNHPKTKINLEGNRLNLHNYPLKNRAKRVADPEGFIIPAKHLIARNPKKVAIDSSPILATPPFGENETIPTNPQAAADNSESPEQAGEHDLEVDEPPATKEKTTPKKRRPPPFFVTPRADFGEMLDILRLSAPSLQSKMTNTFLKLTVETEEEYRKVSHDLSAQGAEFKTFNLKQDRPLKLIIRGLPRVTPLERVKFEIE